jgi:hypothetical protein
MSHLQSAVMFLLYLLNVCVAFYMLGAVVRLHARRIPQPPRCPYCPPDGPQATSVFRQLAWCSGCGAIYVHAKREWFAPKPPKRSGYRSESRVTCNGTCLEDTPDDHAGSP